MGGKGPIDNSLNKRIKRFQVSGRWLYEISHKKNTRNIYIFIIFFTSFNSEMKVMIIFVFMKIKQICRGFFFVQPTRIYHMKLILITKYKYYHFQSNLNLEWKS